MATRRGDTLIFPKPPVIAAHACIGGKKEGESPLAAEFDELHSDNRLGQASWEAAETQLQLQAARLCLKKAHATEKDVSLLLAGDLPQHLGPGQVHQARRTYAELPCLFAQA